MFKIIQSLFEKFKRKTKSTERDSIQPKNEILYSLQEGINLLDEGKHKEALVKLDIAVESGIFKDAYRERGFCLLFLDFYLDAVDDFSEAIALFPKNANNYHGRARANGSLGYYDAAINDSFKAIELSLLVSKENEEINKAAREKNYTPPTHLYREYLEELYRRKNETNERLKQLYIKPALRRNANI